jgi:hypothetical protein
MLTLFYQTDIGIPNSIPTELRFKGNTDYKSVVPTFIVDICKYLKIPINQVNKKQWQGESAYYHVEIAWIDYAMIYRNIFYWIDYDVLEQIKDKNSKLKLLLWFPNEGFSLSMPRFIDIIDFCIKDMDIPAEKVYFVFGDINIQKNYKKWKKKLGLSDINVYGFDSFEASFCKECDMLKKIGYSNTFLDEKIRTDNLNKVRPKRFIFKNANPREHRLYFAAELASRNLLDKSYYSWLNRYFVPSTENFENILERFCNDSSRNQDLKSAIKTFIKGSPYIIDFNADTINEKMNQRLMIPKHFANSYFTFVTETTYENSNSENVLFLTEKIYQPIVQYHPFIVAACPGTLSFMKSNGYQTFPELFDETYDEVECVKERSSIILDNIEKVSNMPVEQLNEIYYDKSFQQKLIENKNNFFSMKGKNKWKQAIKWLDH